MTLTDAILSAITKKAKTATELSIELDAPIRSVRRVITTLHKEKQQIHIGKYKRGESGPITACFLLGNFPDVRRPLPYTALEKSLRYQKTSKGKASIERKNFKRRGMSAVLNKLKSDTLMRALFTNQRYAQGETHDLR